MWVASRGDSEKVALLLEAGADAGARSGAGETAFSLAVGGEHSEAVGLLRAAEVKE